MYKLLLIALIFPLAVFSQNRVSKTHNQKVLLTGEAQGTTYHITYYGDSVVSKRQVDSLLSEIDSSLSIYKSYSLISKFNQSNKGVIMDKHLSAVVKRSAEIYKVTGGLSDITIYPLMNAWGMGPHPASDLPDPKTVKTILGCVGFDKLRIVGTRLEKLKPCVQIDVNGIAQGYSVDVLANFFDRREVKNYLVEIGGELRVKGRKPDGKMMQIGIEAPAANSYDEPVIQKVIALDHGAVTTSGNYRKFVESGKKKMSHLMNPHTGYPFQNELISVTVRARDAITADGYDNALMGMGLKKALVFLKSHHELEAYFIYHKPNGTLADYATAGFLKN